jgi:hypothetical protein
VNYFKETPDSFLQKASRDKSWAEGKIIEFLMLEKERARRHEIVDSTVANFKKPVRLFLEMNDVSLNWKKINRLLPPARRYAKDRAPTIEEIRTLVKYEDVRVETIVLIMCSSGMRVGAWDYLKVGSLEPVKRNGKTLACIVRVYENEPEEYITFITPEAYGSVENYLHFRELHGEKISPSSPLMRDIFNTSETPHNLFGTAQTAKQLKHGGIKHLLERAMWKTGLRQEKKRRHEFAADHGFRKFFKTRAEQVMKPINVEWILGHSTGISDSYYRPTEQELLNDYLKAVPLLTISEIEEVRHEAEQAKSALEERLNRIEAALSHLISQKELQALALDAHRKPDIGQ